MSDFILGAVIAIVGVLAGVAVTERKEKREGK